jgi:hypothetical protein
MAIEVYETPESRQWDGDNFELHFKVEGTEDDAAARWAVLVEAPVIWDGRVRQLPTLEPDGPDTWDAVVRYVPNEKSPEIGDCTLSWKTGGGQQHITQALSTVGKYAPAGKTAPENYGAIGARPDGTVEGVDILVPDFSWSERYTVNPGMLSWAYAITCAYLTRCVNLASFRGFAAGEVQFRGSSADVRLTGTADQPELRAEIQYDFAAQPNISSLTIGSITGIYAKGWEYVDVRYEQVEDAAGKKLTPQPYAVYVHRVYPEAAFGPLAIGS